MENRASRTPEQKQRNAERERERRASMTPEQKKRNAERDRERQRERRASMMSEQIQCNAERDTERHRERRALIRSEQNKLDEAQIRKRHAEATPEQENARKRTSVEFQSHREHAEEETNAAAEMTPENAQKRTSEEFQSSLPNSEGEQNALCRLRLAVSSRHVGRNPLIHPQEHYIGGKDVQCDTCEAKHFEIERNSRKFFSGCCASGSVQLRKLNDYPLDIQQWLVEPTEEGKHFRKNIRNYNSAVAFASFGFQPVKFNHGIPVVVIHGQTYHKTASNIQGINKISYAQLYILDAESATEERLTNLHNVDCRRNIMKNIDKMLRNINPYAHAYQMMKDVIAKNPNSTTIEMCIIKDRKKDPRRYNLPIANEVAAVFVSEDGEPPFDRDICVHPHGQNPVQNVKIISPNCDPMVYPLLFPKGDQGWQPGIPKKITGKNKKLNENRMPTTVDENSTRNVSMLEFYSFRLQDRSDFNPLLHAGKLTQQFIIDALLKLEGQRLQWNRLNQKTLRVDLYMGLMDYVNSKALGPKEKHLKPGRMIILPSSFSGGQRAMQQNYQDAMVLVAKYGKPDLFITFTCNPKWKEITENLECYETAADRPDLVATVFYLKLRQFMNDLTSSRLGIFGRVDAFVYVIEFQKRGLPHCHLLLILKDEDKIKTVDDVDLIVCAEIPDESDGTLFEIVKTCMMHGPCGVHNLQPRMAEVDGKMKCSKDFPKPFCNETNINVDGYPVYRRRNDGKCVEVRGSKLNNQWVVPYNPYLSRKYNAHINVENCSTVKSVKYVFKYIYKGHDAAVIKVNESGDGGIYDWDEIKTYIDTRYIAAPEAIWRLRKYDMQCRSHSIERLPVHLPCQQTVIFDDGDEERCLRREEAKGTKLTKYFQLNDNDSDARKYFYHEIPYHFVWKKNSWEKRQQGQERILSRMYAVSPKDIERFCLRLLLLHVKGATSFTDLKTVDGKMHCTFKDAAIGLNLLHDNDEWMKVMEEAVVFRMPSELRNLFASILIHGECLNPLPLYDAFKKDMYEDYMQKHSEYMAEQLTLRDIEETLKQFGKTCKSYSLPEPVDVYVDENTVDLEHERSMAAQMISMMNAEQRTAFGIIMGAVNGVSKDKLFYLSGAGGCGKTFVYQALTSAINSENGLVRAVAPTGLAATLLKGGRTVHSGFGIPIDLNENTTSRFKQTSPEYQELLKTKLIIWDEISMFHKHLLCAVDRTLRFLLNCKEPFGGIPIVVGGDFRQQGPVVVHGKRVQIVESCVKSCSIWKQFKRIDLVQHMRVNVQEKDFCKWLLQIGAGMDGNGVQTDLVKIPSNMVTEDIVTSVFGSDINTLQPQQLAERTILCPKNEDTLKMNERIMSMLNGSTKTYYSIDSVQTDDQAEGENYPLEFLHSLTPMGLPPHV